ncbi:MAG: SCO family protein [Candidatus Zixiibacteriota bacterium]|nr:MAG: SCO family protein [candidate division Zixibacteria bacterium]
MNRAIKKVTIISAAGVLVLLSATNGDAQAVRDSVAELDSIGVDEKLGGLVPFDLVFTDDGGQQVNLGDYFAEGRPVILVLAYYECPMLCNLILNGLTSGVKELDWKAGAEYRVVVVSINPRETYELAAAKKKNYIESLGTPSAEKGWSFLVGEESQSRALADAVGFKYYWVQERQEYAHPAVIYLLSGEGRVTRYLYGIEFARSDLRLGLLEASEGKIGNTIDRLILYCYHYDPDARSYVIFAGNVMRLGGAVTVVLLGIVLGVLWYRERRRRRARPGSVGRDSRAGRQIP